eukprot:1423082-Rhodomonas_salina.2
MELRVVLRLRPPKSDTRQPLIAMTGLLGVVSVNSIHPGQLFHSQMGTFIHRKKKKKHSLMPAAQGGSDAEVTRQLTCHDVLVVIPERELDRLVALGAAHALSVPSIALRVFRVSVSVSVSVSALCVDACTWSTSTTSLLLICARPRSGAAYHWRKNTEHA